MKATTAEERRTKLQKPTSAMKTHADDLARDAHIAAGGVNLRGIGSDHWHFGFKALSHEGAFCIDESPQAALLQPIRRH